MKIKAKKKQKKKMLISQKNGLILNFTVFGVFYPQNFFDHLNFDGAYFCLDIFIFDLTESWKSAQQIMTRKKSSNFIFFHLNESINFCSAGFLWFKNKCSIVTPLLSCKYGKTRSYKITID